MTNNWRWLLAALMASTLLGGSVAACTETAYHESEAATSHPSTPTGTPSPSQARTPSSSPVASPTASSSPEEVQPPRPQRDEGDDGTAVDDRPEAPEAPSGGGKAEVNVSITFAEVSGSKLRAAAVVENIIEDGGTCVLDATFGGRTASAEGSGIGTARSVSCAGGLEIPVGELPAGVWTVAVSYDSERYTGVSAPIDVEVGR